MSAAPRFTPRVHLLDCPDLRRAIEQRARRLARGPHVAAEDLASLGRVALLENPVDLSPDGRAPFLYALTIAVNAMKDAVRSARRLRAKQSKAAALALLSSHQFDAAESTQLKVCAYADPLEAAMELLSADERAVVRAVDLEGGVLGSVAANLGVSLPTACRLRKSAHERLRRILGSMRGCLDAGTPTSRRARGTPRTTPSKSGPGSFRVRA